MTTNGHLPFWKSPIVAAVLVFVLGQLVNGVIYSQGEKTAAALSVQKVEELEKWKMEKEAQITRMDSAGTQHSTWMLSQMLTLNAKQDERLEKLENNSGKIDVIAEKMARMQTDLADLRGRK